jgi:hypothetical protein
MSQLDEFSVDLFCDLDLKSLDQIDYREKSTSLFCAVSGNISEHLDIALAFLEHLGHCYRGVMFIDGALEHKNHHYKIVVDTFKNKVRDFNNVIYLHNHVIVIDGLAFVGANCWYKNYEKYNIPYSPADLDLLKNQDINYLSTTIHSLQKNEDIKRIILLTNSIPSSFLSFDRIDNSDIGPVVSLSGDLENKVHAWLFGGHDKNIDDIYNGRRYVNNPNTCGSVYFPKRVSI